MSKSARVWVVGISILALAAGGIVDAQTRNLGSPRFGVERVGLGEVSKDPSTKKAAVAASLASGGTVSFVSGQPIVQLSAAGAPVTVATPDRSPKTSNSKEFAPAPGVIRAEMPPVTVEESRAALKSRTFPRNLNQGVAAETRTQPGGTKLATARVGGDANALGPASIPELARALLYNPDVIYQYVRNNIEYYPTFGIQKGALGAVLDNQGTAHDQATLLVELLRASGYQAVYVRGIIQLTAAQVKEWYGVETSLACGIAHLLGQAQIPIVEINATSAGSCPTLTAAMTNMSVEHVWVKVLIGGTWYHFDPSYKPHTLKVGIDLASPSTTGYDAAAYLASAQSGATITADYAQNINRANIRSNLTTYANNLATYLRSNKPTATLDDLIGGKTIDQFYSALRQTALPYQRAGTTTEEFTDLPTSYKPTLRVQYQGIDQTYTSDVLAGKRLTITFNGSNQPILKLDGVAVGSPGAAVTTGALTPITFTVTHTAYSTTVANQNFTQKIRGGGGSTFLITNGWGPTGRGPSQNFRSVLNDLRAAGAADGSEPLLGSTLAVIGAQWMAQTTQSAHVISRIAETAVLHHHHVGIVGYTSNAYVDLAGNVISVSNVAGLADKSRAAFSSFGTHLSILESTAVQQTTNVPAVSTVKLLDIAVAAGQRIYNATSANYATAVQPNLVNCAAHLTNFSNYVTSGTRLILPSRCDITENSWSGVGYMTLASGATDTIGVIISDGLSGGYGTVPQAPALTNFYVGNSMLFPPSLTNNSGYTYGDPIDMVAGNYLYDHDDINVGVGDFPQNLSFRRLYSSGLRNQNGSLGKGWTHNFSANVAVGSDGFQAMGEDSALDAVGAVVEQKATFDLLLDSALPVAKLVTATLGERWFGDQLLDNTVIVTQGLNGEVFVKLPDGSYNPPPGKSAKLTKNGDGTYSYESLNRSVLKFNAGGKAETYTDASGLQVKYTYSGNDLAGVSNSLGRTLTMTNSSGRITQVSDGTRSVAYGYDSNSNLTTFTDSLSQSTVFGYGLPGQMTSLNYPSFPTVSAATNVYDTLGRVKTQTNARGKTYNYFFAGSRTSEVGPGGVERPNYIDALGNIVRSSTPLGFWTVNTYDGQSRLIRKQLPELNAVEYTYDDATCASAEKRCTHNVLTTSNVAKPGSGFATTTKSFTYESTFNKVATATDARNKITSYTYTAQGLPLSITSPLDPTAVAPQTTYGYTAYTPSGFPTFYLPTSQTVKTTATNSVTTATAYNASNRYVPLTSTVDSGAGKLNLTTTFTYDAVGNVTLVDGPRTDVTDTLATAYDSERRPTQTTNAIGKQTRTAYDPDGRAIKTAAQIGAQWLVSCSRYSETGKVTRAWGPAQTAAATTCPTEAAPVPITDTAYDDLDRAFRTTQYLTAAEGGNRVTETVYNADDTVKIVNKAVGTAVAQAYATYTYNPNGTVLSSKDAKNNLTAYQYDGFDRLGRMFFPLPATPNTANVNDYEQYAYDANNNQTGMRKRNGQIVNQTWDNLNRLFARTYPTTAENVQFAYDLRGLKTAAQYMSGSHTVTYAWDNAGRQLNTAAGGKTLVFQYDAAGNRIRTTWPDAFYTTVSYDALNRPGAIQENGSASLASYAYDDLGRRTTVTLGNGTSVQRTYDNQGALATLKNFLASTAQEVQYTYMRNQIRELTGATWSNNIYQWTGATPGTQTYTANGLNQYTAATGVIPSYDANGNLTGDGTWTYTFDLDNRLRTANKTGLAATLSYDAAGRLRQTAIGATTANLLYDGAALVAEYDAAGTTVLRKYVHGAGTDEPIVWYEGAGTTAKNWLYKDHLGSVIATANGAGASTATYSYGPFGEPNVSTGLRFRYTGQQLIGELGLYYYKARFYSPVLGRFLQTDPIGYKDDQNLYAYVKNNPINSMDPAGTLSFPLHYAITLLAGLNSGLSFVDSASLAWNAMAVDFRGTQGTDAMITQGHSMAGVNSQGVYDTPGVALTNSQNYIAGQIFAARNGAPEALGNAIHSAQDQYSPSHQFQEWRGFGSEGIFGTLSHVFADTFPGWSNLTGAYDRTAGIIQGQRLK
ncbi:RHS repeat-associated protein [Variovorax sp. W1I1]|uniref:RHS repeat-associated core domain-containing protein n=1 Tax=Variovorax sp. W1I1 TaxID=3042309 RepID=UPI002785B779|nr:RHS repeat-associated core domain-containing protein [Variovorax sp. W1I1]MDQ0612255.1 RHS repeat-associated protein [Variovorax sp. W1I1]